MGYAAISIGGSDNAMGMFLDTHDRIVKILKKEVKQTDNEFNTSGAVNVGLFFEGVIAPGIKPWLDVMGSPIYDIAIEARELLNSEIARARKPELWDSERNRRMHLKRYLEIRKAISKYTSAYKRAWGLT